MDEINMEIYKDKFDKYQLEEIQLGLEAGLDVSVYAKEEFFPVQMAQIRLGMMEKLPVVLYAIPDYDWFQMEEIRKGLQDGIDVSFYAKPEIPYEKMREIREGIREGINLSEYVNLEAGILRQLKKAKIAKIDIMDYINGGYDAEQLEEIRYAIQAGVDIKPYLTNEFRGVSIREIRMGLEHQVDVDEYAKIEYNWRQMREIRLGLEHRVDISKYNYPLYTWQQMYELRHGLEAGLDISSFSSIVYTATDMFEKRTKLMDSFMGAAESKGRRKSVMTDEFFNISVSANEMQAYIQVKNKRGFEYTVREIVELLNEAGITAGIMEKSIEELLAKKSLNITEQIAKGVQPKGGKDGYYEYLFRTNISKLPPVLPDGTIDYQNTEWFVLVEAGQKLAVYHPAEEGTRGYTVKGEELSAPKGREQAALSGAGFVLMPDKVTYIAAIKGRVELRGNRLYVGKICVLDDAVRDLEYTGSIYIKGNVRQGVSISATEDIVIGGCVNGVTIKSGGNILLKNGMAGAGTGKIEAKEDVVAKFLDSAIVVTGGNIMADYALNCVLYTEDKIVIRGKDGVLAGGTAHGDKGIETCHMGSYDGIRTVVSVGIDDVINKQQLEVERNIEKCRKEMKIFQEAYMDLRKRYSPEARSLMDIFRKVEAAIYTEETRLEELRKEDERLTERKKNMRNALILIRGQLNKGVAVEVNRLLWEASAVSNVTIKQVDKRIMVYPNEVR